MCFELMDSFQSVHVEDANVHVVRATQDPILPRDEFRASHRQIAHLKNLIIFILRKLDFYHLL